MSKKEDHDLLIRLKNDVSWIKGMLATFLASDLGQFIWHNFIPKP